MSKREYTFLGSPRSSPVKVLEEWPGSINLQLDSQHHTHASYSQSLSRATGPSSSTSGLPTASQMPEGMDIVGLESASLAKASRGNSIKDKDMLLASSFQNRERSGHGSEAMLGSHEGDPSEERFMTPPERRSRRSSPEGEESEKQGQSSHLMASGAQQPAVSRALVFQSLDSPDEDGPTYLEAHDDMAPRQHAPATDNDMTPMSTGMEDDDDDVTILDERPASRGGGSSRRQRRRERGTALGAAAGEGDEDAQGGDGDPQSQEDADLALAKAMQEQECAFLLLHQQQQQYSYSFSPGLAGTGSSNSQRLASRDDSGSSRGHRSNSGGLSQATDRLSVYPQDTTGAATGSQLLHQRQEQRQSQGEGQGPQGRFGSERGGSWEEPAFEESLQAFGDASGAPEEDTDNGEGAEISDEEFARRLQEEEERQMAARLMAMAGVGARPLIRPRGGASVGAMGVPAAARDWVLHGTQGGGGTVGGEEDEEDAEEGFEDEEGGEYGFYEDGAYEGDVLDVDNMSYEELTALGEAIGTEAKGLAPHVIASLPRATFVASDHHRAGGRGAEGDDEICAICRCEFEDGDSLSVLVPCKHSYHEDCIAEWLKLNKLCPICKAEVHLESGLKASRPKDGKR